MRSILFCTVFLFCARVAPAQEKFNTDVPRNIIIIKSTKDYRVALSTAKQAAEKTGKKLDLRDYHPNKDIGLSLSPADAKDSGSDYPTYIARGNGTAANDDYISIEYSDAYKGFAKGYYIIVAGITDTKSNTAEMLLNRIKKVYPDAYAKRTYVLFGNMY